jgi:hypothetical protein
LSLAAGSSDLRPVEFRACHFREGKGLADLQALADKFREYANKNDIGYAAWILLPEFQSEASMDVGWLGAWPDGIAYGVSMEKWKSRSNDLLPQFQAVIQCGTHELMMSRPINAPDGTPEDGILLTYACTLKDGKTLADAYKAHLEYGQVMKTKGSLAVSWMYTPAAGFGKSDVDYYHSVGFYRYSDLGDTMEMFFNRGGVATRQNIIDPVASCLTPVVYDAISVRAHDERNE